MKCGRKIGLVKEELGKRAGIEVLAVSGCGSLEEKCYRNLDEIPDDGDYMLTVIVKDR